MRRRSHGIEILGIGHVEAHGMKAGHVANIHEAEEAIRRAVDLAERAASVQLESVAVSVSAGRLASETFNACVDVVGSKVTDNDIARVLAAGSRHSARDGRVVMHSLPIGFSLDDARGVREPRGMLARQFGVDMHVATCDIATPRNLMLAVEQCHLTVEAMVASPYTAGLSVLADDESDLGSAVVDMGAGTTTIAAFSGGRFVHADGFALGGQHVTLDLARGLNARITDAERIKTFYGTVLAGGNDERDMITVPAVSDDSREPPQVVSRATLVQIIRPRIEEILEMVRDRLAASPFAAEPRGTIVLTGGACQLPGLPELAARILGRQVRIGRPLGHFRFTGGGQRAGLRRRGRTSGLSAGGPSRTFRTAANAANDDRNGRLHLTGRTMAEGELLMTRNTISPKRPVADRPVRRRYPARVFMRQP